MRLRVKTVLAVALATLGLALVPMVLMGQPTREAASRLGPSGRYQMMVPAEGSANFVWVLDSQTGEVTGYRFASVKHANSDATTWVTQKLQDFATMKAQ